MASSVRPPDVLFRVRLIVSAHPGPRVVARCTHERLLCPTMTSWTAAALKSTLVVAVSVVGSVAIVAVAVFVVVAVVAVVDGFAVVVNCVVVVVGDCVVEADAVGVVVVVIVLTGTCVGLVAVFGVVELSMFVMTGV